MMNGTQLIDEVEEEDVLVFSKPAKKESDDYSNSSSYETISEETLKEDAKSSEKGGDSSSQYETISEESVDETPVEFKLNKLKKEIAKSKEKIEKSGAATKKKQQVKKFKQISSSSSSSSSEEDYVSE